MKKAVAFANIAGLALAVFGAGCVNLDKPSSVAACASGKTGPCVDGDKKDAALAKGDVAGSDTLPNPDRPSDTANTRDDASAGPDAAGSDLADAGVPTGSDAAADTPSAASPDGSQGDAKPTIFDSAGSPDDAAPEVSRPPIDGPPTSADLPEVRASDAGPDGGPDLSLDTAPDLPSPDGPPGITTTITFKSGRATATGVNGYAWVTLGSADTVTFPTCGAAATPITAANPCTADIVWGTGASALCVTGTVPALSAGASDQEYAANWGVQVGTNIREPVGAGGLAFKSVAVNITGTPSSGLRLELHRSVDPVGTTYCALFTPGTPVPLSKFNTQCWNDLGAALSEADAVNIDKIGVQVSSGSEEIAITNLCLNSIVLGN
jgi:hypothetical protein